MPVIAIDAWPSIPRHVSHELDGLVVRDNSIAGLTAALDRLMANETERKKFASHAPEVVDRFPMQAALQHWDELLSQCRVFSY